MSMILAETHFQTPRQTNRLRFAFTVVATALLTMILVPAAALAISYMAGGAATSTILFVYLFALLTNGPFAVMGIALIVGAIAMPRLVSGLAQHRHA
jgi:hypothetical protein